MGWGDGVRKELVENEQGDPERTERGERGRPEGVVVLELPHTCEQLCQSAVGEGETEYHRLSSLIDQVGVEETEDERRQGECGQAQWGRVGYGLGRLTHRLTGGFTRDHVVTSTTWPTSGRGFHNSPPVCPSNWAALKGGTRPPAFANGTSRLKRSARVLDAGRIGEQAHLLGVRGGREEDELVATGGLE